VRRSRREVRCNHQKAVDVVSAEEGRRFSGAPSLFTEQLRAAGKFSVGSGGLHFGGLQSSGGGVFLGITRVSVVVHVEAVHQLPPSAMVAASEVSVAVSSL
jgi:hypothetical protein